MKLNIRQQEAIELTQGPCLVLAGAGSGKTRVITNKIAYLIQKKGFSPKNIIALTFTNKAAREMKHRIGQVLSGRELSGLTVSTFHTLGLDIIKKEYKTLELKPNFSLFDAHDQFTLLKEITDSIYDGDKELIKHLQSQISLWKNDLIDPEQAKKYIHNEATAQIVKFYLEYQTQLHTCSILDFDDLILLPTLLLKNNSAIREKWQQKVRYLLVDEYQDTNKSQYLFIQLLVGERANFTVVGDDDQSIYAWRGANPENLTTLQADYPNLTIIKLEQNYRSTERILHAANILIENNPHIFTKKLFSDRGKGDMIEVITAENEEFEAEKVVKDILTERFKNQSEYGDFAILYRGNHQSRLLEKLLLQHRIPYQISGDTSFFSKIEIKDIMAYLRLLTNPDDDNAFLRVINIPKREIGTKTIQEVGLLAKKRSQSLFKTIFDSELLELISPKKWDQLMKFGQWIQNLIQKSAQDPIETVHLLLEELDYESWIYQTTPQMPTAKIKINNVNLLIQWLESLINGDDLHEPLSLNEAIMRFTLRDQLERNQENQTDNSEVQLMTLHASKGLEFPYVYLIGLSEGILPHQNSLDANLEQAIEEERRLAYVGLTRAQKKLTLSHALKKRQYGEEISMEPSRFLLELPQDDLNWKNHLDPALTKEEDKQKITASYIDAIKMQLKNTQ